jgi:hypothetical protein
MQRRQIRMPSFHLCFTEAPSPPVVSVVCFVVKPIANEDCIFWVHDISVLLLVI